jgi:plasmid stability protein
VTITLDDETARWARVEAARHDTSVSRWVGQLLDERRRASLDYDRARTGYLERAGTPLREPGDPLPSRDELYTR